MLEIKDIEKLINVLTEVKKEKENKQLELLQQAIKKEIIKEIENVLLHFESESMIKFLEETKNEVCFDYNYNDIIETLEDKLGVNVWEVN